MGLVIIGHRFSKSPLGANNLILKMAFAFLPTECFDQSNIVQDNTSFPPKEKQAWSSTPMVDKHGQLLLVLYIENVSF